MSSGRRKSWLLTLAMVVAPLCSVRGKLVFFFVTSGRTENHRSSVSVARACCLLLDECNYDRRWWNDIGMPMTAIQVYMLLFAGGPRGGVLNASRIYSADLLWEGAETWAQWTGENRIWTRTIVMQKGLLHANETSVNASFEDLFSTVVVEDQQDNDGIMPDGSFHQHGR